MKAKVAAAIALVLGMFTVACGDNQNPVGPSANPTVETAPEHGKDERTFGIVWSD